MCNIGFECKICGEVQSISFSVGYSNNNIMPICNKCLSDLKEIILEKRKEAKQ